MSLTLNWKSDRYEIDMIQEFGADWINITLSTLIDYISSKTLVPPDGIKLLSSGGTKWEGSFVLMKDVNVPLSFYKLKNKSKILMLGDISQVHKSLSEIKQKVNDDIIPLIQNLFNFEKMELSAGECTKLHLKISELLMQFLFKVDALDCELDSEKQSRKELVKWIQGHLNSIDATKREIDSKKY